MSRRPTQNQAQALALLGGGVIAMAPGRRKWAPLVRWGWVEPIHADDNSDRSFFPPLRITPDGLRALADALDADLIARVALPSTLSGVGSRCYGEC